MKQPAIPPFTAATARAKVQAVEDTWNTRIPEIVALASSEDAEWRNRDEFITGRDAIREFLRHKWSRQLHYRLRKELWAYTGNRISVRFETEWQHAYSGQWYRSHGIEHWEFDDRGLMRRCDMSVNDIPIAAGERRISL